MPTPATKVPAKAPKKAAAEANAAPAYDSKASFAQLLNDHKDEHYSFIKPKHRRVSTGSLILDSLVKIRSGSVVRLLGRGAELGKSSEAFVLMDNYMKVMPKSKGLLVLAEARLSPEMEKRCGLKFVRHPSEWVYGTVLVYPCNIFENVAGWLEENLPQMHEAGENLAFFIDSLDGMSLRSDRGKQVWIANAENEKIAGVPKITKLFFKRLGLPITYYDVLAIFSSQFSVDIKSDPYAPGTPRQGDASGGNAIAHQADYAFQYTQRTQGDHILEKPKEKPDWRTNKQLGVYATLEIKKSGTDVSGTRVKVPIRKGRIGSAIWIEREIVDMMMGWELLKKKSTGGSWLLLDPRLRTEIKEATGIELPEQINGENNAYAMLEDPKHKAARDWLFEYFRKLVGGDDKVEDAGSEATTSEAAA